METKSTKIPVNQEVILNKFKENTLRFRGATWYNEMIQHAVAVIGVGGIGSWLSLFLSRLQPSMLTLVDMDRVEEKNLSGQFYRKFFSDYFKVQAMKTQIKEYSDYHRINTYACSINNCRINMKTNIMLGLDNMLTRRHVFESWKNCMNYYDIEESSKYFFCDGRLNAEEFQIFTMRGCDKYLMKVYEENYLFDDSEVEEQACSYKQTTHCAAMIASLMTNLYVNHIDNLNNSISRRLPFFTYYNAETMTLKTQDTL